MQKWSSKKQKKHPTTSYHPEGALLSVQPPLFKLFKKTIFFVLSWTRTRADYIQHACLLSTCFPLACERKIVQLSQTQYLCSGRRTCRKKTYLTQASSQKNNPPTSYHREGALVNTFIPAWTRTRTDQSFQIAQERRKHYAQNELFKRRNVEIQKWSSKKQQLITFVLSWTRTRADYTQHARLLSICFPLACEKKIVQLSQTQNFCSGRRTCRKKQYLIRTSSQKNNPPNSYHPEGALMSNFILDWVRTRADYTQHACLLSSCFPLACER